ncbi:MAG: hypothetical protein JWN86_3200 [Planctomycetota bacterium]|nr:hypothetical protein [Planctomycetota bacterium]
MTTSPSQHPRPRTVGLVAMVVVLFVALPGRWAAAQADKAAGVFDEVKPASKDKPAATKEKDKPAKGGAVDRETIGFTQENAASQMAELEERMFRLSEALRGLEPENASRLRLALKFSREELILEQMRETNKMLKDAQLAKAETEVRELLAKLQHLRDVLLAEDLDFQLKIARLRQMRETISQLDRIVKDERRELGWSRFAIEQRRAKEKLAARRPDLEALARDQKTLVAETKALDPKQDAADLKAKRAALRDREATIGKAASALAADPLFADFQPSQIRKSEPHLTDAASRLGDGDLSEAAAAEERAEAVFLEELKGLDGRIAQADRDIAEAEFRRHEDGQLKNRRAAETLGTVAARLGDSGVSLQKDLIRAGGAMQGAEKSLAKAAADPAATDQSTALDILTKSSEDLAKATETLLVQLRTELQSRLIAELTEMHEIQASIRETTQAQAPKLATKSRAAAIAIAGQAQKEGELAARTEQLLALVEETDFGIALPTALRVLSREMRGVEDWLKATDASGRTIAMEQRIEDDLLGLVQAIRRLPPTTPPPAGSPLPSGLRERERELNRLVAELKMIRLLQSRLNDDTVGVDKTRPGSPTLPPALRREVEALESIQEELRESLSKIAERIEQQP